VIQEQFTPTSRGGILYDATSLRKPGEELFSRAHWQARQALEEVAGGRGSIAILRADERRWVLRHYRRGGWVAGISRDRYWWLDEARTRSFLEWRLLAELHRRGLPVPAPIAASYTRSGLTYQADLITEQLPASRTLTDSISGHSLPEERWRQVGRIIAAFHVQGVHHADLNAHNILLDSSSSAVYVLDFDRGRIRERGSWEQAVINRLQRSLEKTKRQRPDVRFAAPQWNALLAGYREAGG
jgi:3-deoxy-D-manno-octulosonic acid kinase